MIEVDGIKNIIAILETAETWLLYASQADTGYTGVRTTSSKPC
jgi:hypothetical protein